MDSTPIISADTLRAFRPRAVVADNTFPDYDRYLKLLVDAVRYKLRINAHKGDLGDYTPEKLLELHETEMAEVREALNRGSEIEVILECADGTAFLLGLIISAARKFADAPKP